MKSSGWNWKRLQSPHFSRNEALIAANISQGIILLGGKSTALEGDKEQEPCLDRIELLEWDLKRWWTLPKLKESRHGCAVATVQNTILIVGGRRTRRETAQTQNDLLNTVERLTFGSSNQWESVTPMTTPRLFCAAVGLAKHNSIIVMGGQSASGQAMRSVEILDFATNRWQTLASMTTSRSGCAAVALDDSKVLVVGGSNGIDTLQSCEIYDYTSNTWTEMPSCLPLALECIQATRVIRGEDTYVFVRGRNGSSGSLLWYHVASDEWTTIPSSTSMISGNSTILTSMSSKYLVAIDGNTVEARFCHAKNLTLSCVNDGTTTNSSAKSRKAKEERSLHGKTLRPSTSGGTSTATAVGTEYLDDSNTSLDDHPLFSMPTPRQGKPSICISGSCFASPPFDDPYMTSSQRSERSCISLTVDSKDTCDSSVTSATAVSSMSSGSSSRKQLLQGMVKKFSIKNMDTNDLLGMKVVYTGHISATTHKPHGKGTMMWKSTGDTYTGCFRNGSREGTGLMLYKNGDIYDGMFQDNERHGYGIHIFKKAGRQYNGIFVHDKMHDPNGTLTWNNGTTYVGNFDHGRRTGYGIVHFPSNVRYEGNFVDGKYEGRGVCKFADGSVYEGEWKKGQAHGQGRLVSANGQVIYDGQWLHDSPVP